MERVPLSIPDLRGNEAAYLAQCVETNWISSAGSFVTQFEEAIAVYVRVQRGVAAVNGTCALELALRVAGVQAGDTVIVPNWTFVATANAVCHIGAQPHFIDVTRESWTLDPALLEQAIAEAVDRVAAIVPVHSLGHPADMDAIMTIADRHGVPVVEDAAGALGSRYKNRMIGGGSTAATLSFNGNKLLTCGSGGMILTDDAAFADRCRRLSAQSRQAPAYRHDEIAFNYRMSNVNAAIGMAQFERLEEMLAARRAIAARYRSKLLNSNRLRFMPTAGWAEPNGWLSALHCSDKETATGLLADFDKAGIDSGRFWEPLSDQNPFLGCGRTLNGVAAELEERVLTLPSSSSLDENGIQRVFDVLERWT